MPSDRALPTDKGELVETSTEPGHVTGVRWNQRSLGDLVERITTRTNEESGPAEVHDHGGPADGTLDLEFLVDRTRPAFATTPSSLEGTMDCGETRTHPTSFSP
ncbi:hypothetical protein AB4305_13420 [Nocardia sp. 2YAB30]|uniref:hypothetical protein n=1 Tax=unclassified Nocardia TaxID=2637762 RepID=UPI003F9932F7